MQALINIAIEEMCETANALLAPVRMGVARPTAPFSFPATGILCLYNQDYRDPYVKKDFIYKKFNKLTYKVTKQYKVYFML